MASLEEVLMKKARIIVKTKFPDDLTTTKEFRRKMSNIRLNNANLKMIMNKLQKEGQLKARADGIIILNGRAKKKPRPL